MSVRRTEADVWVAARSGRFKVCHPFFQGVLVFEPLRRQDLIPFVFFESRKRVHMVRFEPGDVVSRKWRSLTGEMVDVYHRILFMDAQNAVVEHASMDGDQLRVTNVAKRRKQNFAHMSVSQLRGRKVVANISLSCEERSALRVDLPISLLGYRRLNWSVVAKFSADELSDCLARIGVKDCFEKSLRGPRIGVVRLSASHTADMSMYEVVQSDSGDLSVARVVLAAARLNCHVDMFGDLVRVGSRKGIPLYGLGALSEE